MVAPVADLAVEMLMGHWKSSIARNGDRFAQFNRERKLRRDLLRFPADGDLNDFRGHADSHRHEAAAEPAGDDDVTLRADVAVSQVDTIARRNRR